MAISLREAFDEVPQKRSGRACLTCVAMSSMSEEDVRTFNELLKGSASSRVIFEACQKAGYSVMTLAALRRHRRGECLGLS